MSNFSFDSWETTPVLVKELDQETIQAMVPIGQSTDGSILVMILSSELESENENSVKQIPRWKYHNMVAISESVLTSTESDWRPFLENDQYLVPSPTMFVNAITPAGQEDEEQEERASELSDSDDDYWGQYGDTEDEAAADEGLEGTTAKTQQPGNHLNEASTETPNGDEDDEDDEYWRKYAEQQEEQEAEEKKKKLKEHPQPSSSGFGGVPVSAGFDSVDLSTSSTQTRIMAEVEDPKLTCSKVGQVDPNMLSSLLQMLSSQGLHQVMSKSVQEEQIQKEQELQMPLYGQQTVSSQEPLHLTDPSTSAYSPTTTASSTSPSAVSVLETSLRSVVQQATLAGLSKDKVFEVLTEIYAASSLH
ncbi:hypothetical protein BGZ83_008543 [Gryganskiella cystojenkinii]|nr:hypothetical protein BGZ83_008543 [Gryganskiella cystojenkinii]